MATQKLQVGRAFAVNIFSDDVPIPFPELSASGTTTSGGGGNPFLNDTNANFVQGEINPGDIVYNTSTGDADIVVGVNSPTQIELAGVGAGFNTNELYEIYAGNNHQGCVLYVGTGGDLEIETVGSDSVILANVVSGQFIPVQVMKVKTGTTASDILALW